VITFELLHPDARLPQRQTGEAAGYDAYAYIRERELKVYGSEGSEHRYRVADFLTLQPYQRALIPLGFKARLPSGFEAQVRSRSGLVLKNGIYVANQPGTIDSDYAEEWGVILGNMSTVSFDITHGMRIAQIVLGRISYLAWTPGTIEGNRSGFGSTGVGS